MASRKKKDTHPVQTIAEEPLPEDVPKDDAGEVSAQGVELDADQVHKIGAVDAESVQLNRANMRTRARKEAGEKNIVFNDTNGMVKYEGILSMWPPTEMTAFIQRIATDGGPAIDMPGVPCASLRTGAALYDHILRTMHRSSPPATYLIRIRAGTRERGTFRLNLPDTLPQQAAPMGMPPMGMQFPWMGYPPPGYPPPGYPPPGYDHHTYAPPPPAPPAPAPAPVAAPVPQFQPVMQPPPPPPPTSDPAAQAWMGAMHQMLQQMQHTMAEKLDQRGEMAQLMQRIEELRQAQNHPISLPPVMQPAVQPPPGFGAPMNPYGMPPNPYAGLGALPRPPGYPEHLPWPPNPMANPWGTPPPYQAPPVAAAPVVPEPPADPLDSVRRSVELVGSLATLMERVRGVAPAIGEVTAAAMVPTRPPTVETVRVGDVDVAMNPETGDISWMHTLIGVAPKAFSFLEKISGEVAKTTRAHEVSQAIQSGRMPLQYGPPQYQQPQYQPPPQQQFAQQQQPQVVHAAAPAPAYVAPAPQPRPVVVEPIASPTNGAVSAPLEEDDSDESVKSLFS
jgi:hypothetical protein